jgi:hypothetical protein
VHVHALMKNVIDKLIIRFFFHPDKFDLCFVSVLVSTHSVSDRRKAAGPLNGVLPPLQFVVGEMI